MLEKKIRYFINFKPNSIYHVFGIISLSSFHYERWNNLLWKCSAFFYSASQRWLFGSRAARDGEEKCQARMKRVKMPAIFELFVLFFVFTVGKQTFCTVFFHHHSFSTGFWGINKDDNLIWNLHIFQTIKLLNLIFNKDVPQEYFVPFPGKFSWELFFIIREDLFIVWWHFLWLPLI